MYNAVGRLCKGIAIVYAVLGGIGVIIIAYSKGIPISYEEEYDLLTFVVYLISNWFQVFITCLILFGIGEAIDLIDGNRVTTSTNPLLNMPTDSTLETKDSYWICDHCQYENVKASKFCEKCGQTKR